MVIQVDHSSSGTADTPSQTEGHKADVKPVKEGELPNDRNKCQVQITCHTSRHLISN